jgi:hypothetical protein
MSLPASTDPLAITESLRAHFAICERLLAVVASENQALRDSGEFPAFDFFRQRKNLASQLDQSLAGLKRHRHTWQRLTPSERAGHPQIAGLLRSLMDLIMRVIVLDRENEQALLRRGLLAPQHLPSVQRQRPHYVADLYRRHANH